MCADWEMRHRQDTRQLDKLEWMRGTGPRSPHVNPALATKRYERSSAGKVYRHEDVRTLESCSKTMEFLISDVLENDIVPSSKFIEYPFSFLDIYSYVTNRMHAVRVDLSLQQFSCNGQAFIETYEQCLRFEMLSHVLLMEHNEYDSAVGLKVSQIFGPLLQAYQDSASHDACVSSSEAVMHRYILFFLLRDAQEWMSHLHKLGKHLQDPLIRSATHACVAYQTGDYVRFLRYYREADFLSAVAMSGEVNLARLKSLWILVRGCAATVSDTLSLRSLQQMLAFGSEDHARSFLSFHGVRTEVRPEGEVAVLPNLGAKNHHLLGSSQPEQCCYPHAESMLRCKFASLGMGRAEIVWGLADPV